MPRTKRKYIESHWAIFALKGIIALVSGWYIMFNNLTDIAALMVILSAVLLGLGIMEVFNLIHRHVRQHSWGLSLIVALLEIGAAVTLFLSKDGAAIIHLSVLAGYTLLRGVFEVIISFKALTDPTDKFLWIVCGMFGVILGFIIFNAGGEHLLPTTFVQIFGTYLMVFGLTNVVYGVHSKNEKEEVKAARRASAKKKK